MSMFDPPGYNYWYFTLWTEWKELQALKRILGWSYSGKNVRFLSFNVHRAAVNVLQVERMMESS